MLYNTSGQYVELYAVNIVTGDLVSGDAANITLYSTVHPGSPGALTNNPPTEVNATNAKGTYRIQLTQAETAAYEILFTGKSTTSNVIIIPKPVKLHPANYDSLSVDGNGRLDVSKWDGTAVASATVRSNLISILGTTLTETVGGYLSAAFKKLFDVATPVLTAASVNQTGDSFARIGNNGSGLTSLAPASTALSNAQWTNTRAGYLDNLSGGAVALAATALSNVQWTNARAAYLDNLSAGAVAQEASLSNIQNNTRTVIVVPDLIERPDSGTDTYKVHLYLYDEIGNMEAPDSAPTVTLVNSAGTSRSGRLGSTTGTLASTGHYTWTYTNTSTDTLEQLLWEFTVVEGGATRLFGRQSLIVDTTAADFTTSDRSKLDAVYNKLPTNNIADETNAAAAAVNAASAASSAATAASTASTINTKIGTPVTSVAADIAAVKTDTGNLATRIPAALFAGITSIADWIRRFVRKDAGTAGMATAQSEINTGGTATFAGTTDALEAISDASGGGGGSGDAEQATSLEILAAVEALGATALSAATWTAGSITGFPTTLVIGDSYIDDVNRHIKIYYRDESNTPITTIGSKSLTDGDFTASLRISQDNVSSIVTGVCSWVAAVGPTEGYLKVELPKDQTRRASEGVAQMQLVFRWGSSIEVQVATQNVTWQRKI